MGVRRALLVVVAAVLAGFGTHMPAHAEEGVPALIVGDSLTLSASEELEAEFRAAGFEPTVRAVAGSGLVAHRDFWLDQLEDLIEEVDPEVVHIQFSGNHPEPWPVDSFGEEIRPESDAFAQAWSEVANEVMAIATSQGAEVWWALNPPMEYPGPARMAEIADLVTLGLLHGWPSLRLVDWDAALADAEGRFVRTIDGEVVRSDDGVHLEAAGERRVAATSGAAVEALVERVAGSSPIANAIAVSEKNFSAASGAVIAAASSPADALVAAPLAAHMGLPLLLADSAGPNTAVRREISRLGASDLIVVGGVFSLPDTVVSDIAATARVSRISGSDRYETAANVAFAIAPAHVYVARGWRAAGDAWTDALASAAAAASHGGALLFANDSPLQASTRDALEGATSATVVGGALAVPPSVDQEVAALGVVVDRASGAERFSTAAVVSQARGSTAGRLTVAGDQWSWGVAAAALRRPFLIVPGETIRTSPASIDALVTSRPSSVEIVGPWAAVSTRVETEVAILLRTA